MQDERRDTGPALTEKNVEIVRRVWKAAERGDTEAVFELYDPAIVWQVHFGAPELEGVYHGHEGVPECSGTGGSPSTPGITSMRSPISASLRRRNHRVRRAAVAKRDSRQPSVSDPRGRGCQQSPRCWKLLNRPERD